VAGSWLLVLTALLGQPAEATDRLERFRQLVADLDLSAATETRATETLGQVYALLDAEVVESLASGGVFASPGFLQDRLEAFTEVWGGVSVRVAPLGRVLAVTYQFSEAALGSSVRVYGQRAGEVALRVALEGPGSPSLRPLPPGPRGARALVIWEGPPAAHGGRALRLDLVQEARGEVTTTWSSTALFPEGLSAHGYAARGTELTIRHDAHYPGWVPGCTQQTQHEDVLRLAPGQERYVRVSRRDLNPWHRDLHAAVSRLLAVLGARDAAALARLVGDAALRARLPTSLEREPACDAPPGPDGSVAIAAVADGRQPWTLTFRAGGRDRWRLAAATPTIR
jgi:hypothetical protein